MFMRNFTTLEYALTNGLTWKIENENGNRYLTILWANGEELETLELNAEDIGRISHLFLTAQASITKVELAKINLTKTESEK